MLKVTLFVHSNLGTWEVMHAKILTANKKSLDTLLNFIKLAKHSIEVEIYEFLDDSVGQLLAKAFEDKALQGCKVKLTYDAFGSYQAPEKFWDTLRNAGVDINSFNPLTLSYFNRFKTRNHRKWLVVDEMFFYIGGLNFSERSFSEDNYMDFGLIFDPKISIPDLALINKTERHQNIKVEQGEILFDVPHKKSFRIYKNFRKEIDQARKHITLCSPYFLPPRRLFKALKKTTCKGVKIDILIPEKSDNPILDRAQDYSIKKLREAGVNVYLWPGFIHAKIALFDHKTLFVGSCNWDHQSIRNNLEAMIKIQNTKIYSDVQNVVHKELSISKKIPLNYWKNLSFLKCLQSRFLFLFKRFF